jgi:hypothetical protein
VSVDSNSIGAGGSLFTVRAIAGSDFGAMLRCARRSQALGAARLNRNRHPKMPRYGQIGLDFDFFFMHATP